MATIDEFKEDIRRIMMENTHLYERVDDINKIKLANKFFDKIVNIFSVRKEPTIEVINTNPLAKPHLAIRLTVSIIANPLKPPEPRYYPASKEIVINCFHHNNTLYKNKQYDTIIKSLKNEMIHEITHFFDDVRTNTLFIQHNFKNNASELVTPAEFNAYFLGFASKMRDNLTLCTTLKQFELRFGKDAHEFLDIFYNYAYSISPNLKKEIENNSIYETKWNKRVYQLYFELKSEFNGEPLKNFYNKKIK